MILVKNLFLKYIREYYALYDITLNVEKGEKVCFVGEEDSGKTSLIRILAKLEKFNSGEVEINGKKIKDINYKKDISIGYIPVNPIFIGSKNIEQNFYYILKSRKVSLEQAKEKVDAVIKEFGLEKYKNFKPHELPLYERYLASFARLKLRKLDLVLIDNIFDNICDENKELLIKLIFEKFVSNAELTSIIATSNMEIANKLGTRNIYFKSGSLVESL